MSRFRRLHFTVALDDDQQIAARSMAACTAANDVRRPIETVVVTPGEYRAAAKRDDGESIWVRRSFIIFLSGSSQKANPDIGILAVTSMQ